MIYRIHKPNAGYILFYASPEPLESIIQRYPGSTVTESSITELKVFQALADRSYQDLTEARFTTDYQKRQKVISRKRRRKPVFSTKP